MNIISTNTSRRTFIFILKMVDSRYCNPNITSVPKVIWNYQIIALIMEITFKKCFYPNKCLPYICSIAFKCDAWLGMKNVFTEGHLIGTCTLIHFFSVPFAEWSRLIFLNWGCFSVNPSYSFNSSNKSVSAFLRVIPSFK